MEDASKCKNFLFTLIKLATNMKKSTLVVVKALTKDLLEGKLEAEEFTNKLYKELETSPQSYLVPFLTKSVPALRQYVPNSTTFIMHCEYPELVSGPVFSTSLPPTMMQPSIGQQGQTASMVLPLQQQSGTVTPQVNFPTTPMVMLGNQAPGHIMLGQQQFQHKTLHPTAFTPAFKKNLRDTGGYVKDYDELNDVAFMAGVNLEEESANILASNSGLMGAVTHSCEDEPFLSCSLLQERMLEIGSRYGITNLDAEVVNLVSHATQQRLQNLLESVSLVARQRNVNLKEDDELEQSDGARAQLRFLHQLEKQRKEGAEREILLKAAKARTRREDPEQLRLKQKAKEMQQQELAQMRQRQSNMTALAAIGPRKKKSILDSESSSAAAEGSGAGSSLPGVGGPTRQRITRVHRTDLLHCMENDKSLRHSRLLYKWFLK